jgi:hypothetical protein
MDIIKEHTEYRHELELKQNLTKTLLSIAIIDKIIRIHVTMMEL